MTAAIDAAKARAAPLLEPFAGARGGREARDDPRAQWIGDAMLVEPIVRREWPRILAESEALLREVGKDLRIAGIWAAAAFECEGLAGLAAALALLAGLLRGYWDDLQPARARARENALANFYEHLAIRMPALEVGEDDREALGACERLLDELHAAAMDRFAPPPMPRQARAELARMKATLPAVEVESPGPEDRTFGTGPSGQPSGGPAAELANAAPAAAPLAAAAPPKPAPPKPAPPPATKAPAPAAPQLADPGDDDELQRFVAGLSQGMLKAAGALRRASAADPLAYRLLRIGAWLRAARPADVGGKTTLLGLRADARASLEAMARSGKWAALVDAAEAAFARPEARFHLDLHRYTLTALAGLGDGYGDARAAVLGELAALLRRMPGIDGLCDRDGAPLADAATRELLTREGLVGGAAPRDLAHPTGTSFNSHFTSFSATPASVASPIAATITPPTIAPPATIPAPRPPVPSASPEIAGDPAAVIARLQAEVDGAPSPRDRFVARTALAHRCRALGLTPLASSLFVALEREARAHGLAAWEPALCVPVLAGLLTTPSAAIDSAEVARVFAELCLLDPGAALQLAAAPASPPPSSAPTPAR